MAHHLLLGDTLLLTPMLAKLRQRYPEAKIWMTVIPSLVSLYEGCPYGVRVLPYHPKQVSTLWHWLKFSHFDLAVVPGDNRYAWLARALGARTIVALAGDGRAWKDWQVDWHVPWPKAPCTLAEIFMALVDGQEPSPYTPSQWPFVAPENALPVSSYCVMHVSARNSLRRWSATHWHSLANIMRLRGFRIVWSTAPGEAALLESVTPASNDIQIPGTLDLLGLRHLLTHANLLITVETGIAHLCRLTGTPSIVIFGQGNPTLHGNESFWRSASPMQPLFEENISCRDQSHVFGRILPWVKRCDRTLNSCGQPKCIDAILPEQVARATDILQ
ncbi:MAG: glycosyltransferase family 9 protein [Rhodocyclaceae bacterium]|nr:glycosyltransferase family 9 protein [Rhodocyclaceae bacterium]